MEEKIINKIRINKKRINKIYQYVLQYVDIKSLTPADSETLSILTMIAKIDEELTDIIYIIIDNKKS